MKMEHTSRESTQQATTLTPSADEVGELRVIQIKPDDSFEAVLMTLRLQAEPVVLLLPEESQAFNDPSHFAQLRQVCTGNTVSFALPLSRIGTLGRFAHQYGFPFASSLKKAFQFLPENVEQKEGISCVQMVFSEERMSQQSHGSATIVGDEKEELNVQERTDQQDASTVSLPHPITLPSEGPLQTSTRSSQKQHASRRIRLIAIIVALLAVVGAGLLPALFSAQPALTTVQAAVPVSAPVGQVAFSSSGQLDPTSSKGLNDLLTVSLYNLSTPGAGQSYYTWLMPDQADNSTVPLLLGRLSVDSGKASMTYAHPDHENLLALYSRFEVAEQPNNQIPQLPPPRSKMWRYSGSIPNTPIPGDEQHYSLLSHLRHLLAADPTLEEIGLQGGLDIWLYRNAEKILEWASAARDSWGGGQQTNLIHNHMIRVLDYLDGAAFVSTSGDIPPGSPLLVDPHVGRIGLLEVNQTQVLLGYLTHVDIHLQGLIHSPGHTQEQKQLAIKIDTALKADMMLFQRVHQDAVKLVKMDATQLKSDDALSLLNDMVTNANTAYTGQFDAATGGNIDGIVWIHNELQGMAIMPITTLAEAKWAHPTFW